MKNLTLNKTLKTTAAVTAVVGTLWMGIAFADSHGLQNVTQSHSPWSAMSMLSERGDRSPEDRMAYVFDQMGLTDAQREALLPILSNFSAATEAEREAHRAEMQAAMATFRDSIKERNDAFQAEHRAALIAELSTVLSEEQLAELQTYMDNHPMQRQAMGHGKGQGSRHDGAGMHTDSHRGPRQGR